MKISHVGEGNVVLIAGGGKIYTDVAARFVRSERSLEEIIASPYDRNLVEKILNSGHKAVTEFDYFIFGVEGYSRVTETQLVRKRHASYMIKSGRTDKGGERYFDVVVPEGIMTNWTNIKISTELLTTYPDGAGRTLKELTGLEEVHFALGAKEILNFIEQWYNQGVYHGYPEEELRYLKPQATEFKALIGMNAHALLDWFSIRCCKNAQDEIRDMANMILILCKEAAPDLFRDAGPNCKVLGYCPENDLQHPDCLGKVHTKKEALEILAQHKLRYIPPIEEVDEVEFQKDPAEAGRRVAEKMFEKVKADMEKEML